MATVINGNTGIDKVQDGAVNPVTDIASGIPCFSAYQSAGQSLPAATATKLNFQTKEFDITNAFNTTTMRFTPTVAGYYSVFACMSTQPQSSYITLYKNGSSYKVLSSVLIANAYSSSGGCIVYMNGSTDYIEVFGYISGASTLVSGSTNTYFQAHLIVGA